ncbi:protein takeout [Halyomorpha halys]|uniref:protein takeout n=1 Tax=Halyomorpha halys TaxID=286706 RepID=UPI0006D4F125|nr:protein takeout [Halyomorpha halys]
MPESSSAMVPLHVIFFFCIGDVLSALPEGWSACKQSAPDYEDCLKKQVNNALRFFKDGNKKMGIIPLDPLHLQTMDIEQGSGPVSITLKMKNVDLVGLSAASEVTSIKNDWKKMMMKLYIPHIHLLGDYTIDGKVLILPISGSGKVNMDFDKVEYTFDMTFKQVTKNGKKYYQVDKMPVTVLPKKVTYNFENLFKGNKELGDNMNKFLNENWAEIMDAVKPALSKTLEAVYREYINRILSKLSAEEIDIK